jgi:hypothetical protein
MDYVSVCGSRRMTITNQHGFESHLLGDLGVHAFACPDPQLVTPISDHPPAALHHRVHRCKPVHPVIRVGAYRRRDAMALAPPLLRHHDEHSGQDQGNGAKAAWVSAKKDRKSVLFACPTGQPLTVFHG